MTMKIAILAYNAHRNCAEGVARIHYNLYSSLRRKGVEVNLISVYNMNFEETFTFNNMREIDSRYETYIISDADKGSSEIIEVAKRLFTEDFDIIINGLSGIKTGAYLRLLKTLGFKRWKFVESLFYRPFNFLDKCRYLMPFTFKVFVYSLSEYKYLSKVLPFISPKIGLVPPPVDTSHFVKRDKRESLKVLELEELEDRVLIGYVGNPFPDRLPLYETFKAMRSLVSKYDIVFVGVFPPYGGRSFIKTVNRVARYFGLEKKVYTIEKFIDYHTRPFLYSSFDVLLHLYKWREAPYPFLTALEAFSVETPVITTNYNEIKWVLGYLDYPLYIDLAGGVTAISIKSALETYFNLRGTQMMREMLQYIRARIARLFSLENVGRRVISMLED